MKSKTICLQMGEKELTFTVTLDDYNQCVNALQVDNKISPMHNFLVSTSADEASKSAVKQAFEDALTSDLFGAVIKEFKPNVEITVKKSKDGPDKLSKTD